MSYRTIIFAAIGLQVCGWGSASAAKPQRVTTGILALYTFERPADNVIRDRSGVAEPVDLRIEKPEGLNWRGDRLTVTSSASINSPQAARKIIAGIKSSGELTIEVWIKPGDTRQTGPARIVSLSIDPGQRNVTLGQDGGKYDVRLRTSATNPNGIPSIATVDGAVTAELTHVVYCRNTAGTVQIYLNGKSIVTQQIGGDFSGWDDGFRLSLANEMTGDRPWRGELHLVGIYGRSLSADEVQQNFTAGLATVDYAALLPPAIERKVDFVKDVQPILRQRCFECHAQGNEEGGLNLGIKLRAMAGGKSGPVILSGNSQGSPLIHMVAAIRKADVMPPEGPALSPAQIGILRAWIDQGVEWPTGADVLDPRAEQARLHWSFQPLNPVQVPAVGHEEWGRTPIDRFILAAQQAAQLQPAAAASARTLIRRTTFDVIGLPPTPEQVQSFCEHANVDFSAAQQSLIDRLLESPHYGERWGRHWLDVARYADSDGQETDRDRPLAYRYRDFVIRALNDDLPFNQFVRWQLAGNEYEPDNVDAVAATGFLTAGPFAGLGDNLLEDERLRNRYNELDDIVSTIGTGMLGLTLGCVRCHDHKYDAIPARDYYSLLSALQSGDRAEVALSGSNEKVFAFRDSGPDPKPAWLFRRGNFYDRELSVQLGFVTALTRDKTPADYWNQARASGVGKVTTFQRRALAEWITDAQHGAGALVARVIVNRVWQHHFGEALVRTVGDFGVRSERPSHPELLEWLAHDLVEHGWRLKRLHRMILTSSVYQQSNAPRQPAEGLAAVSTPDPDNRLLWKMRPQRLQAEILRDAMLAVSGTLNLQTYGPGFKPPISPEAMVARNTKDPYPDKIGDSASVRRRSVYMFHKRVVPYPLLQAFDKPDAQQSCNRRDPTTVAPQALALLNDEFVRTVALDFADRLIKETEGNPGQWIDRGFVLAIGRSASESERTAALQFVQGQIKERQSRSSQVAEGEIHRRALADLCQALFSLNEFLYVD